MCVSRSARVDCCYRSWMAWCCFCFTASPPFWGIKRLAIVSSLVRGGWCSAFCYCLCQSTSTCQVRASTGSRLLLSAGFPADIDSLCLDASCAANWHGASHVFGVGLFSQFAQVFLTFGFKYLPAARATSISYVQVFFAAVWGWTLLGETINQWELTGALTVMAATLLSLTHSARLMLR